MAAASAPKTTAPSPVEFTVGLKGGINGAYLVPEENFESLITDATFGGDDAGGVGGHIGLYGQVRLWRAVGLELGVAWSRENVSRPENLGVDFDHTDRSDNLRLPLLLKGFLVFERVILSLGIGAEYVKMLDNEHTVEASNQVPKEAVTQLADRYTSVSEDMLFLLGQFEVIIELDSISIPIALRVGKNLWQTDTFEDRFSYTTEPRGTGLVVTSYTVKPIYTWDFRVSSGIGVSF